MDISNENFLKYISKIDKIPEDDIKLRSMALQHIQTLEKNHDKFIKQSVEQGYDLKNYNIGIIETRFYTLMKMISEKLGLPTEEYDEQIKNIGIRIFGEENYKNFFNM